MIDAFFDDSESFILREDAFQLPSQPGMPSELAADKNSPASLPFPKRAGWADLAALAACKAFVIIDDRSCICIL